MCSLSLKEIVTYFRNRGSKVYACFIDASKAFDRLKHDKLFLILKNRGIPPLTLRLIMDMYERQKCRTSWNNMCGEYFTSVNGVRQGGVTSPLLFIVYMDVLIMRLEKAGIGCFIGHEFYGCLGYADDFVILCPSLKGLQNMLDLCSEYGDEYSVNYNATKTVCMAFGVCGRECANYNIMLNGTILTWSDYVKHLGNYVRYDLSEYDEVKSKKRDFIGSLNGVLARFGDATPEVLMKLTDAHCNHLYGCQAWQLFDKHIEQIAITWHRAIRRIWNLPPHSHRAILCGLNNGQHIIDSVFRRIVKMYDCMHTNKNQKTMFLVKISKDDKRSIMSRNIDFMCRCNFKICGITDILAYEQTITMIIELNHGIAGWTKEEVNDILEYISTM